MPHPGMRKGALLILENLQAQLAAEKEMKTKVHDLDFR